MDQPNAMDHFYIAPFAFDGELLGVGRWEISALSEKWLAVCGALLDVNGPVFEGSLGGPLDHIRIRFTSSSGAALVTFSVGGRALSSAALACGLDAPAERQVLEMFVDSLRQVELVRAVTKAALPFKEVLQLSERALMTVVVWGPGDISEQDQELARELSHHLAAAYFQRCTP